MSLPRTVCLALAAFLLVSRFGVAADPALLTVAERSDYRATARHADVIAFIDALEACSPLVRTATMGETVEGRAIPLVVIADPLIANPEEAHASGKVVAFVFANIHAGEVCGKEALPMLAREIILAPNDPPNRLLLDNLVLLLAPIYNCDGNERVAKDNRPGQLGPQEGTGVRENAQGLDLNRDHVKLESPEARSMARLLTEWRPHLVMDLHTTNGSHHRYTLTYDAPLNPSGHAAPIAFVRSELLPEVSRRMEAATGYRSFFYGNFNRDHTAWFTYDSRPRFGANYHGLRNQMSILSEAYSYAPYRDRVLATLAFTRECLAYAAERRADVLEIVERAERETIRAGENPGGADMVGVRHAIAAHDEPATILGYAMRTGEDGRAEPELDKPVDYTVRHLGRFEPTLSVARPWAYVVPRRCAAVIQNLRDHGVEVEILDQPAAFDAEVYAIDRVTRDDRPFQGRRLALVDATARSERREVETGDALVRTAQPLGTLAVYLLEPGSDDGLAAWGFLDEQLAEGAEFPIVRVPRRP